MAEAVVSDFSLSLAFRHRLSKVLVKSDNLIVCQGLHNVDDNITELGIICKSIRESFPKFDTRVFNHGYREVNEGAHIMAHCIANWNIPMVLMDIPLISLIDHLKLAGVRPTSD